MLREIARGPVSALALPVAIIIFGVLAWPGAVAVPRAPEGEWKASGAPRPVAVPHGGNVSKTWAMAVRPIYRAASRPLAHANASPQYLRLS